VARTRFGQNFLVDSNWKRKIVDVFDPPGDFAEIGPGKGAITTLLSEKYSSFSVFEIDPVMEEFHRHKPYRFVLLDFLKWDFCIEGAPVRDFSLIGNLPYESGTAILKRVVSHASQVDHFVFMLQREVAERVCASSGNRSFGSLSVYIQGQFHMKRVGDLPPKAFRPPPKVHSSVVLGRRRVDPHPIEGSYQNFVRMGFEQKRKRLWNNLRDRVVESSFFEFLQRKGLSDSIRAEELDLELWPEMYRELEFVKSE